MAIGRKSRAERTRMSPGIYQAASFDLIHLIKRRFKDSKKYDDGWNPEPIFCIPVLFSCLRILALEIENNKEGNKRFNYQSELIAKLKADKRNDIDEIMDFYGVDTYLKEDFKLLIEIRHEIIHPSPFPEKGSPLPSYLKILEEKKIIWMPPLENYLIGNIYRHFRCHKLFEWSFERFNQLCKYIIESKPYNQHILGGYTDLFCSKD